MKGEMVNLHLPDPLFEWIDQNRGNMARSAYIVRLLEALIEQSESETAKRQRWLAEGRKQYTIEICQQTLQINEEFPVHEE